MTTHNIRHRDALITGVAGQGGSCLAALLLAKGYEVHGIKRHASSINTDRIDHIYQDSRIDNPDSQLHCGDLSETSYLARIVLASQSDEINNPGRAKPFGREL